MQFLENYGKCEKTERRRNYLVSEPNYHTTKCFTENLLAIAMNKTVYLGLSILGLNKILMYEFLYDYVKPKYGENTKLCCMDTDSFIIYIKKRIFIETLQKMLKLNSILQIMNQTDHILKEKTKKVIKLMTDEIGGKIMIKFIGSRAKTYSYLRMME